MKTNLYAFIKKISLFHSVTWVDMKKQGLLNFQMDIISQMPSMFGKIIDAGGTGTQLQAMRLDGKILNLPYNIEQGVEADTIFCFEVLEHLKSPFLFLSNARAKQMAITVPYVRTSRIDRFNLNKGHPNRHIFELSPRDWKKLFKLTGWEVRYEQTYLQYPKWLKLGWFWRAFDFEGFWGAVLTKTGYLR